MTRPVTEKELRQSDEFLLQSTKKRALIIDTFRIISENRPVLNELMSRIICLDEAKHSRFNQFLSMLRESNLSVSEDGPEAVRDFFNRAITDEQIADVLSHPYPDQFMYVIEHTKGLLGEMTTATWHAIRNFDYSSVNDNEEFWDGLLDKYFADLDGALEIKNWELTIAFQTQYPPGVIYALERYLPTDDLRLIEFVKSTNRQHLQNLHNIFWSFDNLRDFVNRADEGLIMPIMNVMNYNPKLAEQFSKLFSMLNNNDAYMPDSIRPFFNLVKNPNCLSIIEGMTVIAEALYQRLLFETDHTVSIEIGNMISGVVTAMATAQEGWQGILNHDDFMNSFFPGFSKDFLARQFELFFRTGDAKFFYQTSQLNQGEMGLIAKISLTEEASLILQALEAKSILRKNKLDSNIAKLLTQSLHCTFIIELENNNFPIDKYITQISSARVEQMLAIFAMHRDEDNPKKMTEDLFYKLLASDSPLTTYTEHLSKQTSSSSPLTTYTEHLSKQTSSSYSYSGRDRSRAREIEYKDQPKSRDRSRSRDKDRKKPS